MTAAKRSVACPGVLVWAIGVSTCDCEQFARMNRRLDHQLAECRCGNGVMVLGPGRCTPAPAQPLARAEAQRARRRGAVGLWGASTSADGRRALDRGPYGRTYSGGSAQGHKCGG